MLLFQSLLKDSILLVVFFPGSSLVFILATLATFDGHGSFLITIFGVFLGWNLAGIINIYLAKQYRHRVIKMPHTDDYDLKDYVWTTWFPAFRANYEIAQVLEGGDPVKVFVSSVRVRFYASLAAACAALIFSFYIDIQNISDTEGYVVMWIIVAISYVVGVLKIKEYYKNI